MGCNKYVTYNNCGCSCPDTNDCGCGNTKPSDCVQLSKAFACLGIKEGDKLTDAIDKLEEICNSLTLSNNFPDGLNLVGSELQLTSQNDNFVFDSVTLSINSGTGENTQYILNLDGTDLQLLDASDSSVVSTVPLGNLCDCPDPYTPPISKAQIDYDCQTGVTLSEEALYAQVFYLDNTVALNEGDLLPSGTYNVHLFTNNVDVPVVYQPLTVDCLDGASCVYGFINDLPTDNFEDAELVLSPIDVFNSSITGYDFFAYIQSRSLLLSGDRVNPDFPCSTLRVYVDMFLTYTDANFGDVITVQIPNSEIAYDSAVDPLGPLVQGSQISRLSSRFYVTSSYMATINTVLPIDLTVVIKEYWGYAPNTMPYGIIYESTATGTWP